MAENMNNGIRPEGASSEIKNPWIDEKTGSPSMVKLLGRSSYVPKDVDTHMQSLDFSSKGNLILGSSSLTSRYWTGSLWYYTDPSQAPSVEKSLTGIEVDNGISDAIFICDTEDKVIASLDNGCIELIVLNLVTEEETSDAYYFDRVNSYHEHSDIITGLAQNADKKWILTGSFDKSMVILDLFTFGKVQEYMNAHSDIVTSIDTDKSDPNMFLSSGQDGLVALWDARNQSCEKVVYENKEQIPTAVRFFQNDSNFIVIGNASGEISTLDLRQPNQPICSKKICHKQISKLSFSQKRPNLVSIAADGNVVTVLDVKSEGLEIMYQNDEKHHDYVRGLAWHPHDDVLWTCGWDKKVAQHKV